MKCKVCTLCGLKHKIKRTPKWLADMATTLGREDGKAKEVE